MNAKYLRQASTAKHVDSIILLNAIEAHQKIAGLFLNDVVISHRCHMTRFATKSRDFVGFNFNSLMGLVMTFLS